MTSKSFVLTVLAAAMAMGWGASAVRAQTWNASADFSPSNNPAGPWAYGTRSTSGGSGLLLLNDTTGVGPVTGWWDATNNVLGTPFIARNMSSNVFQAGTVTWLGFDFTMHPGDVSAGARQFAVTRWTSPVSDQVNIFGGFLPADIGSTDVFIVINGQTVFSAFRSGGFSVNFDFPTTVAVGDTIDFVVGNAGNFANDTTVLNANIVVPSPGTIALAGIGGVVAARRRRA